MPRDSSRDDDDGRRDGGTSRDEADAARWPVLDSTVVYECPWFDVGCDRVRRPDGETADYYWIDPPDAVAVVAVTERREVVLVEEYRPNVGGTVLTPPAGARDDGESFETAAARELREETGFAARDLAVLTTFRPVARMRQTFAVVLARDLTPGDQQLDDGEFIDVRVRPIEEALATVAAGPTLGWALLALHLARGEL